MQRLAALLAFCLVCLTLRAASPLLTLENEQIPSPAGVGAHAAQFFSESDGPILLTWTEPGPNNPAAQHSAKFDPQTRAWTKLTGPKTAPVHEQRDSGEIIVSKAGRMAKAWFVADEKDPRVLVSTSPNAGEQFLMPVRVEDSRPCGMPDLVLLADGTVFVSWPEHYNQNETALWLRRISPGGSLSVPVLLTVIPTGQPKPKLALVNDSPGASTRLLLAYTLGEGDVSQIVTRLLTIAPPTTATKVNPCHACPDADEATRGYALRGRIVARSAEHGTLKISHGAIAGVLPAATTEFKVDPATLKQAADGNEVFARIEKRDGNWWLFAVRLIVHPETPSTHRP